MELPLTVFFGKNGSLSWEYDSGCQRNASEDCNNYKPLGGSLNLFKQRTKKNRCSNEVICTLDIPDLLTLNNPC